MGDIREKSKDFPVCVGQVVYVLEYDPLRIEERKVISVDSNEFCIEVSLDPNVTYYAVGDSYTYTVLYLNQWVFVDKGIAEQALQTAIETSVVKTFKYGEVFQ